MTATATSATTVIPFLRYADARAAIGWLGKALGFVEKAVFDSPDGKVGHAELRFDDALVMLSSTKSDALALRPPRELGGSNQSICLVVSDPDAHHARALSAGAEIVWPLNDTSYGARCYACRDPEGHLWIVGDYRPAGGASLAPELLYADGRRAIAWLHEAFGMEEVLVVPTADGGVYHAELRCPGGVVMLTSHQGDGGGLLPPATLRGVNQGVYVVVDDVDAHYRLAMAAGATVVLDLKDTDYGSREYTCRDPEGHLWSFGTYRP